MNVSTKARISLQGELTSILILTAYPLSRVLSQSVECRGGQLFKNPKIRSNVPRFTRAAL